MKRFNPDHFGFIWIDECHHAPAITYRNIIDYFRGAKIFGCTATLDRLDGEGYEEIFQKISFEKSLAELIREGWLSRLLVRTLPVTIDLRGVRRTAGDFNIGDLSQAIGRELEKAADQVVKNIADRTKALCFTPIIHEAQIFADLCRDRGVAADYVSGECSDRREKIARFRTGEIKLLTNCAVLTEGFDCPDIDTIVLLRPTQSRALLCQQIGRATRLCTGKEFGLLLDFFWLTARHKLCAPGDIDGIELEPSSCGEPGPGGPRKSLADKLSGEGVDQESEYDPFADEPLDPFDIDGFFDVPHIYVDPWRLEQPSEKQVQTLSKLGIPLVRIKNRGVVEDLFKIFKRRWESNLATVPQVRFLKILGHPDPWNATFPEANSYISARRRTW